MRAIKDAGGSRRAVELLIKSGDLYRTVTLDWHGGLKYPRLEKIGPAAAEVSYTVRNITT